MPGSRVVHCAQAIGGRMPPVLRDSGGPEGRQKTSLPPAGFPKPSPPEAGVELASPDDQVRAAGRGVDAQCGRHRSNHGRPPWPAGAVRVQIQKNKGPALKHRSLAVNPRLGHGTSGLGRRRRSTTFTSG